MESWRRIYHIPEDFSLSCPSKEVSALVSSWPTKIVFYHEQLQYGLRFPLSFIILSFYRDFNVPLSQIHPKTICLLLALQELFSEEEELLTTDRLLHHYYPTRSGLSTFVLLKARRFSFTGMDPDGNTSSRERYGYVTHPDFNELPKHWVSTLANRIAPPPTSHEK